MDYRREVAHGREGGANIKAVPRPRGGRVVVATLPLLSDVNATNTAATLRRELTALASLVEQR